MEIITSKSNLKILEAKKLLDKKYRDKLGLFLVETEKVVKEALSCGLKPKYFFVQEDKNFQFLNEYMKKARINQTEVIYSVSGNVLKEISTTVTPDGIVAVFEKPQQNKEYIGGKFLILDCLQNPDNFGAIMRTALACGFKQIFTINSVDEFNPKTIRASMGNQFKLDIIRIGYDEIKSLFKDARIFTMDMNGNNLFNIKSFDKNTGFVIGNEGNGISSEIRDIVKDCIAIPMQNNVESLNASVSASVLMYYVLQKSLMS